MAIFDRFRKLTSGTVINKKQYAGTPSTGEHIVGTGKNAMLSPPTLGESPSYSVIVRGTVRPGGKEYTHEIYLDPGPWSGVLVGDKWPVTE